MRDTKSILLLLVSFLLLLVSLILLWTWGERYYSKKETVITAPTPKLNSPDLTRDSLQKIYTAAVNTLDAEIISTYSKADSIKGHFDQRLGEFYTLRTEIETILKNKSGTADLGLAGKKISELQSKLQELYNRNRDIEDENNKLKSLIEQIRNNGKTNEISAKRNSLEDKMVTDRITPTASFSVSEIKLAAMGISDEGEEETMEAGETKKLLGSFTVKNPANQINSAEMVVVVLKPDGQVLQKSTWESGSFQSAEGKKIYSLKLRFDYNKGEAKPLQFYLTTDKFLKGNYTLQLYHNGQLVGRTVKTLS